MIWKERYLGRTIAGTIIHNVATAYFVALATLLTGLAIYYDRSGVFELIRDYLRGFAVLAGILLMFGLGLRLAGSVTRERERQTLEALLTIPEFRRDVLQAKWVGAWLRTRVYGAGLVLALLLCALTGTSGVSPCFFALMVVLVHATFAANLGLYLSLVCRTTARASISFALIFLFLIAGSWAALELLPGDDKVEMVVLNDTLGPMQATFDDDSQLRAGVRALNPLLTWWHLLDRDPSNQIQSESEFEQRRESRAGHRHSADYYRRQFQEGMALLWGTMIYLAAAGILWLLADRRFRRQAEHGL